MDKYNNLVNGIAEEFGSIEMFNVAIQEVMETMVVNLADDYNTKDVKNALAILSSLTRLSR